MQEIEGSIIESVDNSSNREIREKLEYYKRLVGTSENNAHKFASAKTYFEYNLF